jgi:3'(2'), 5'-bisphosphate nucleotidase
MNNQTLLPQIIALAKQAGDAIMSVYLHTENGKQGGTKSAAHEGERLVDSGLSPIRGSAQLQSQGLGLVVQYKKDDSPLTQADLASHEVLVRGLSMLTPEIPILSEEGSDIPYEVRAQWKTFWLLDPLDGTKEFIQRNGDFTVNVALIQDGAPILGVVFAPAQQRLYYAAEGVGAFLQQANDEPCPLYVEEPTAKALRVVVSRSHAGAETEVFLEKLRAVWQQNVEVVSVGSSLKLCYIADRSAHLYPRFGPTMEWDIAAAQCIVEQAGGVVFDLQRERLTYNKPDLHNPYFMAACDEWLITP